MISKVLGRSRKKRHFFRNYVSALVALCDENNRDDRVGISMKIYAFVVLSGVLFPCTPYGAAYGMLHYMENIQQIRQHNWAKAIWHDVMGKIEDT